MGVGIYCDLESILYVLDWHLGHMCAFGIWFEMLLLGNFHDGFDSQENMLLCYWVIFMRVSTLKKNILL